MPNAKVDTGHGAAITFGTSGQSFNWLGIKPRKESRAAVPSDHLGSAKMTKRPGDMPQYETASVKFQVDSEAALPVTDSAPQTITITWPLPSGGTTNATDAGTGMIVGVELDEMLSNTIQTGTLEIEYDAVTGPTFTPGT